MTNVPDVRLGTFFSVDLFSSHANIRAAHRKLVPDGEAHHVRETHRGSHVSLQQVNEQELVAIAEGYRSGQTVADLARMYGYHRATISAALRREGVPLRPASPTHAEIREMVQLYESGLSLARVSERVHFSPKTILKYLVQRGVPIRDTHGRSR